MLQSLSIPFGAVSYNIVDNNLSDVALLRAILFILFYFSLSENLFEQFIINNFSLVLSERIFNTVFFDTGEITKMSLIYIIIKYKDELQNQKKESRIRKCLIAAK